MMNYQEFLEELTQVMLNNGVKQTQIDYSLDYFHGKGYLEDYWQQGFMPSEAYTEIKQMTYYK